MKKTYTHDKNEYDTAHVKVLAGKEGIDPETYVMRHPEVVPGDFQPPQAPPPQTPDDPWPEGPPRALWPVLQQRKQYHSLVTARVIYPIQNFPKAGLDAQGHAKRPLPLDHTANGRVSDK